MGFPHQVLPTVAVVDMSTAVAASFHLGLLPRSLTLQAHSMLDALTSRFQGTAPAIVSHRIVIEQASSRSLLFWMLGLCIVRCLVILLVWSSVKDGIEAGRVRSRSEDYSGRAVLYSIVCVISVLMNLGNLNTLFQSRGAPPDAMISTILLHMSASSLAAEQLIISGIEWLLFVIVAGTNGLTAGPDEAERPITSTTVNGELAPAPTLEEDVQTIKRGETAHDEGVAQQIESQAQRPAKKDYGSLTADLPAHTAPMAEQVAPEEPGDNVASHHEPQPSSSTTSNGDDSPDPSAMSSDIVDIPTDRKASMMGAKERLLRARENGKVRRRSLWKKIRGKGGEETLPQA